MTLAASLVFVALGFVAGFVACAMIARPLNKAHEDRAYEVGHGEGWREGRAHERERAELLQPASIFKTKTFADRSRFARKKETK